MWIVLQTLKGGGVSPSEGHGLERFTDARLMATSVNRAWSPLSAVLRSHPVGEFGVFTPQNAEITQIVRNTNRAYSIRPSDGVRQEVFAIPGTIRLQCPLSGMRPCKQISDRG
jgi:AraC family transcriptional regulator